MGCVGIIFEQNLVVGVLPDRDLGALGEGHALTVVVPKHRRHDLGKRKPEDGSVPAADEHDVQLPVAARKESRIRDIVFVVDPDEDRGPGQGQENENVEKQRTEGVARVALVVCGVACHEGWRKRLGRSYKRINI